MEIMKKAKTLSNLWRLGIERRLPTTKKESIPSPVIDIVCTHSSDKNATVCPAIFVQL